jgi:medium-chain acyl-CoA ligase, mitochondrial
VTNKIKTFKVAMNPAYQLPELDYCLKKVDVKAMIIPEAFRTQKYYEMVASLIPSVSNSLSQITDNKVNSLRNIIVLADKALP